jgi:ABC-type nitrate/sulfonate/bicarbonate transport system permease component
METAIPALEKKTDVPPLERPLPKPTAIQAIWDRWGTTIITIINLSIFVYLWQLAQGSANPLIDTRWIPAPFDLWKAILKNIGNGQLVHHGIFSARTYLTGFGITIVAGTILGIALGLNPTVRSVAQTYVWIGYSSPMIALLPIITVVLGFGVTAKVVVVMLQTFWPMMINVLNGVGTVDPILMKAGRVFGAKRSQQFRKIIIPSILPWIMTGIRVSSRRGLSGVIIAEIFGSTRGLAYFIALNTDQRDSADAFVGILGLMLIAMVVINGLAWLEEKLTPWRQAVRL